MRFKSNRTRPVLPTQRQPNLPRGPHKATRTATVRLLAFGLSYQEGQQWW